jgi:hypothetical protein
MNMKTVHTKVRLFPLRAGPLRRARVRHSPFCRAACWASAGRCRPDQRRDARLLGVGGQGLQNMMTFLGFPEIQVVGRLRRVPRGQ